MGHFSPRSLAAAMSRTVMRRVLLPPYSALLPSGVARGCGGLVLGSRKLRHGNGSFVISRRPDGVPGSLPWWHPVPVPGSGPTAPGERWAPTRVKSFQYETVSYRSRPRVGPMSTTSGAPAAARVYRRRSTGAAGRSSAC